MYKVTVHRIDKLDVVLNLNPKDVLEFKDGRLTIGNSVGFRPYWHRSFVMTDLEGWSVEEV